MTGIIPKKIHNPIPPEYANVFILRTITIIVGIFCLLLTGYATWIVYTMSNRIALYRTSPVVEIVAQNIDPIDFSLFEQIMAIDEQKQTFKLPPITKDMFYDRMITSTETGLGQSLPSNSSSTTIQISPSSTTHL